MPLSVLAVTGGRADWGLLSPVLKALHADPSFGLAIVATGQHLMQGNGGSAELIAAEGFRVDERVDMGLGAGDDAAAVTKAMGRGIEGFAEVLARRTPDMMLVLGDRYEILGAVSAALLARVPVAHICGGDITEGAIDDSIRHAITKMAHIHFVTNVDAAVRVTQMGEDPAHVHVVGSPGLDHIRDVAMERDEFFESAGFAPRARNIIATYHPVTLEDNSAAQCREMLAALAMRGKDTGVILTGSNADPEGATLTAIMREFAAEQDNFVFHESLGTRRYFAALRYCDAMVGNSSSGLYEAPSFALPAVNIGNRQKGRLRAQSVIDCPPQRAAIGAAIDEALARPRTAVVNPYGDGRAAEKIAAVLKMVRDPRALTVKKFYQKA